MRLAVFQEIEMPVRTETVIETGDRIAGIARSTEAVSIGLLDAIDGTVEAMLGVSQVTTGFAKIIAALCDKVSATPIVESAYLDPDDVALDILARTAAVLKDVLPVMVKKRAAIDCDCRLKDHHCEALHDAYEAAMSSVVDLIDVIEATRSEIVRHDLAAEPRNAAVFSTVDALIANLRSQ